MTNDRLVLQFREFLAMRRHPRTRRVRRCERRIVEMSMILSRAGFEADDLVLVVDIGDPPSSQVMPRAVVPRGLH